MYHFTERNDNSAKSPLTSVNQQVATPDCRKKSLAVILLIALAVAVVSCAPSWEKTAQSTVEKSGFLKMNELHGDFDYDSPCAKGAKRLYDKITFSDMRFGEDENGFKRTQLDVLANGIFEFPVKLTIYPMKNMPPSLNKLEQKEYPTIQTVRSAKEWKKYVFGQDFELLYTTTSPAGPVFCAQGKATFHAYHMEGRKLKGKGNKTILFGMYFTFVANDVGNGKYRVTEYILRSVFLG